MHENFVKPLDFLWHNNYNIIVAQKVRWNSVPKTGRPKAENPLTVEVKARIDVKTNERLNEYCERNNVTRTEVVRKGIEQVIGKKNNGNTAP